MPKPKISQRKRELLNAAAALFRYKGYSATSMRDLAENVGLEASSLYSHIKSKSEILITLCFHCAELYSKGLEQIMDMDADTIQKIDAIIDLHINIAIDHPSSITVFNDEWKHLPKSELNSFLKMRKEYELSIKEILKKGIKEKVLKDYPIEILLNTILNSMRWIHYSNNRIGAIERSTIQVAIKGFIRNGIEL